MQRIFQFAVLFSLAAAPGPAQDPSAATAALIARAKSLELATPYVPPPGDPLSHHAAGYAKVMCSAVFITGLDPDFAAANVGFFVAPRNGGGEGGRGTAGGGRGGVRPSHPPVGGGRRSPPRGRPRQS